MSTVFKGEHLLMQRVVAIKVLSLFPDEDEQLLPRFLAEMRAVAQLRHPNIVAAMDAGCLREADPDSPVHYYLVMEYVAGLDLEETVIRHGPLPVPRACEIICEVAGALADAHEHGLIHRDVKPLNILLADNGQAKVLDFGLVRHFGSRRLTRPGMPLGTVDYMAPEQARDASSVDQRADIYGLGGTLFWCLTGRLPFETTGRMVQDLVQRQNQPPPSARHYRPDIPAELDAVLARMLAIRPDDRYASCASVIRAVRTFCQPIAAPPLSLSRPDTAGPRVLIVDDEPDLRRLCRVALEAEGLLCEEAGDGAAALEALAARPCDLVLSDLDMPGMHGSELLQKLREAPPVPNLKVLLVSGRMDPDEMSRLLSAGADDYLAKPLSLPQLQARVKSALRLKGAQDRSDRLYRELLAVNAALERDLAARDSDVVHARNAVVLALAELVQRATGETSGHLRRLQRYSRCLAEHAAQLPAFTGQIEPAFIAMLESCVPLHDIGQVALPDYLLQKPGKLDADEQLMMQTHTVIGAEALETVARQHGAALAFLQVAIDIARHHHERWDGSGYPDRLAGPAIPLAARIVAIADVYDALRCRRPYRPALPHAAAVQILTTSPGHFDPNLMQVFERLAPIFERIFATCQ
jgi:response regulator RpfG family c-di-GMP phosphodiesterase